MFDFRYLICAAVLCIGPHHAAVASPVFNVTLDTSALASASAVIAFDFIDGDTLINNTVTISGFTSDGAYNPAAAVTSGDVTGALDTTAILGDRPVFNELAQPITLGNALSFTLTLSNRFSGLGLPDRFTLFLLDPALVPLYPTDDPTGADALLAIDLTGGAVAPVVYPPTATGGAIVAVDAALPEPPVWLLLLLGAPIGRYCLRTPLRRT